MIAPGSILKLSDDVISDLLGYCEPEDVGRIAQACKRLCRVATSWSIWAQICCNLKSEYAPCMTPGTRLQLYDAIKLRGVVVDAVRFKNMWRTSGNVSIVKDREVILSQDPGEVIRRLRVVPGGKDVLLVRGGVMEFWSLEKVSRLWTAPSPQNYDSCTFIDLEAVGDHTLMIVARYGPNSEDSSRPGSVVRIFEVDRKSREARVVSDWLFPSNHLISLSIHGDYFFAHFSSSKPRAVVDWRNSRGAFIGIVNEQMTSINSLVRFSFLFNGHIVALVRSSDPFIFSVPLSKLEHHWRSNADASFWKEYPYSPILGARMVLPEIESRYSMDGGTAEGGNGRMYGLVGHIFRPSWRAHNKGPALDEGELYVVGCKRTSAATERLLVSYHIHLSFQQSTDGVTFSLVNSASAPSDVLPRFGRECFLNSGHLLSADCPTRCFALFGKERQPPRSIPAEEPPMEIPSQPSKSVVVDPWSRTILCATRNSLSTYRFE